jgi:hypothetical protein
MADPTSPRPRHYRHDHVSRSQRRPIAEAPNPTAGEHEAACAFDAPELAQAPAAVKRDDGHPSAYGVGDFEQAPSTDEAVLVGENGQQVERRAKVGPAF